MCSLITKTETKVIKVIKVWARNLFVSYTADLNYRLKVCKKMQFPRISAVSLIERYRFQAIVQYDRNSFDYAARYNGAHTTHALCSAGETSGAQTERFECTQ